MRLLLVEDDIVLSQNIRTLLMKSGYAVDLAGTIEDAWKLTADEPYDCIVLDRTLPDGDGLSLVNRLREAKINSPILMLTARNQTHDLVEGLDAGADDYLSKPFKIKELTARIRALLRRADRIPAQPILKVGDLIVDSNTHEVSRSGKKIELSPKEYAILEYLCLHPGQLIDRMTILEHAWGETVDLFTNTVDVHIRYLRIKIDEGKRVRLIQTVRGKGYMICGD